MEQIKTKTLAEVYLKQGHFLEAYEILRTLAEKDPSDQEIMEKLRTLRLRMGLASPSVPSSSLPKEDRIKLLKGWLSNIQSRRRE